MSSTVITSTVQGAIQGTRGGNSQLVQIVKLPQSLENSARAIRLEGQVTSQNSNKGTVTVATDQGAIEVKIKGTRQPATGQKIEIEIPAGRNPKQATIRTDTPSQNANNTRAQNNPAPPPTSLNTKVTQEQTITPQTRIAQAQEQVQTAAQARVTQANVQNTTSLQQAVDTKATPQTPQAATTLEQAAQTAQAKILNNDITFRLLSIPPVQSQNIAKEFLSTLPPPLVNALNSQSLITKNLTAPPLQLGQTTALQTLTPPINGNAKPAQINLLLQTPAPLNTPAQIVTNLQPATLITPQALNTAQLLLPQNAAEILNTQIAPSPVVTTAASNPPTPSVQNAKLTALPISFDPLNPNSTSVPTRINQIDIQILKIIPTDVVLKAPLAPNIVPPSPIPAAIKFVPPLLSFNSAATITAQVTGFTPQGLPMVTLQGLGATLPQSFILQSNNTTLQIGAQLQIIPKGTTPALSGQMLSPVPRSFNSPLLQGFQWQALDELYSNLLQTNTQAASSLTRALPNAGNPSQMGAAAMVFIAAVKSGDFEMLLGDKKIDLLQRMGKSDILTRLRQDSAPAVRTEAASGGDWRAVPLPMYWDNEIHKITLYTRNENQGNGQQDKNENGTTRFIFDLSLSRMGDVQIDGLIKDKRLDLVIRTQNAFSPIMQQTMRQAYTTALGFTELAGELNFQGSTKNWVHVLKNQEQLGVSA